MSSRHTSLPNRDVPFTVIDTLLGWGLSYNDWEGSLQSQGYSWNENLKNVIIKREFEYFKDEILRLRAEPNTAAKGKDVQKTNSSESILKRLQGLEWAKGKPREKEQRRQSRRLLGKDAKIRSLQKYVKEWERAESSGLSSVGSFGDMHYGGNQVAGFERYATGSSQPRTSFSQNTPDMMPNLKIDASRSGYPPTNCRPNQRVQTYGSSSTQQANAYTQPGIRDTGEHFHASGSFSTYSSPGNPASYGHATFQVTSPNHDSQYLASHSSIAWTSNATSPNSLAGCHTNGALGTAPPTHETAQPITSNPTWPENAYSTSSTEAYDTGAQIDWMVANGDGR